ncbi:MAG: type II secretion system protein GspG [Candidatus Saccharicenans sp.]|nr:type II secretion system protein GspG [Candidatus Saccharicenans sp.]
MKGKGTLAILLLVAVVIFFVYFLKTEKKAPVEEQVSRFNRTRAELTSVNLEQVGRAVQEWMAEHEGRVPESLREMQGSRSYGLSLTDGWGRNIRYQKLSETEFELRSAGQDGQFDTEDDVVRSY